MQKNASYLFQEIFTNLFQQMWVRIRDDMIWENRSIKLLWITIDNELNFAKHFTTICIKANRKLTDLTRMRKYLHFSRVRLLFKSLFESQSCPKFSSYMDVRHNTTLLNIFKKDIRRWKPKNCSCRNCLNYVDNLGFAELLE